MNTLQAAKMKAKFGIDDDDIEELEGLEASNPVELRALEYGDFSETLAAKLTQWVPQE